MNLPARSRVSLATFTFFQGVAMSRGYCLSLLIALWFAASGCTLMFMKPLDLRKSISAPSEHYRVELCFIPEARLLREDGSPMRDWGGSVAAGSEDRLLVFTRTWACADRDENDQPIEGTMRDRRAERLWITIPRDAPAGEALKIEELEQRGRTGYEVNHLDGKGYLRTPCITKGFTYASEEKSGTFKVVFDVEVRPNRVFGREIWKVGGRHLLRKGEKITVNEW